MFDLDSILEKAEKAKKTTPDKGNKNGAPQPVVIEIIAPRKHIEQPVYQHDEIPPTKPQLLSPIIQEMKDVRVARARLSNQYHELIDNGASQGELQKHYQKIEEYTKELQRLWERRKYVERYGHLPVEKEKGHRLESDNMYELKDLRRSLNNRKSKINAKLRDRIHYPEGSPKRQEMQVELDKIEAEQVEVNNKIRRLKHD